MKFYDFESICQMMKRVGVKGPVMENPQYFYNDLVYTRSLPRDINLEEFGQAVAERSWYQDQRPYYNIWPSVLSMFRKLNLSMEASAITQLSFHAMVIRLPVGQDEFAFEAEGEIRRVQTILLAPADVKGHRGIAFWVNAGEQTRSPHDGKLYPILFDQAFRCLEGVSIEEEINNLPALPSSKIGWKIPTEIIKDCVRLCCTLCLLEKNPEIITPDVLNDDRRKWEDTKDDKYADKAFRRRKQKGWDIGRYIEIAPHVRRPHDALYWTGEGRKIARIVFRKGSIIHKDKLGKTPTGFLDKD